KTVAEQEESIKRLRVVEEAERTRQQVIIAAEAEAQENLVKDIKAAEAAEAASKFKAREALVLAESRQQAAELEARAKIRLAEGIQAETAASGLAEVQVKERDADAIEKVGRAEALALGEKLRVEAEGAKAMALIEGDRLKAQAEGEQAMAMAGATAIGEKLKAEAEGLTQKAAAMAALDEASRGHEEYRLRLEADKEIRLKHIDVTRQVAESQATVLAAGLAKANIDIVGGDTMFFDKVVGSITTGKAVDGFMNHSQVAGALAAPYLNGTASLASDLATVVGGVRTEDIKNLTVSALLLRLIQDGGPQSSALGELLETARRLGVADSPVAALAAAKG
ncbi:MAG: flotillin family protein, partial [Nonomuraea sp.]|nr:flotillin family protein [Nonomuraea sp.]